MGQPTTTPPGPGNWRWDERKDQWFNLTPEEADAHSAAQVEAEAKAAAPTAPAARTADTTIKPQE